MLVAIPGTMCAPSLFDRLRTRLADIVDVEAVSWMTEPGPWDIPTIADRIADRMTEPAILLGHSTGGAIAMQLALTRPELVSGLLITNSGAHMRGHGDVAAILAKIESDWGPQLHAAVFKRSFSVQPDSAELAALLAYAAAVPKQAALDVLRSQRDLDLTPRLAELRCPVTVLHGVHDPARHPEQARELAESIPGARLRYASTGHSPVYEDPDLVATEVIALRDRVLSA